jgi:FAD/FMN-containing dehydrogenase
MSSAPPASGIDEFRERLEAASPPTLVAPADDRHAVDGYVPALVVRPRDEDALSDVLAAARASRQAVITFGAGQHLGLGNTPAAYDVAIETSGMEQTIEN